MQSYKFMAHAWIKLNNIFNCIQAINNVIQKWRKKRSIEDVNPIGIGKGNPLPGLQVDAERCENEFGVSPSDVVAYELINDAFNLSDGKRFLIFWHNNM